MATELDFERPIGFGAHFSVHVAGDNQVLLLSEQRSFRLSGKLYVAMVPHLDGTRTGADVIGVFSGRAPEERVRGALSNLFSKNYIVYRDKNAPAGRQALWSEMGFVPTDAERNLSGLSIAVKAPPGDSVAASAARMLRRAATATGIKIASATAADLTVVCVQDYLDPSLPSVNRSMRKSGRSWALFKAGGSRPLLGPVFRPDAAPCWACLATSLLENRPGDRLADASKAARPARAFNPVTLDIAVNFAALEFARAFAQGDLFSFDNCLVSIDLKDREHRTHLVRPNLNCPVCGPRPDPAAVLQSGLAPVTLRSRPMLPQTDGGWRIFSAEEVNKRLDPYVSPLTGIIAGLADASPKEGLPVFQATQTNPVPTGPRANRLIGRPSGAAGKGMGPEQAKASCLAEAMERYLCGFTGHEPRKRAVWAALGDAAPHPNLYLNYSERQYDGREAWNANHPGFNWVGERFDEQREIEWTPAWSLTHGATRWLPTRYCYFGYSDSAVTGEARENEFCVADSNGCASGSVLEEAILQGFLELAERDACALWWYNRVQRPAFVLDASQNPFFRRVQTYCESKDRGLHILDITNDFGVPSAIAISYRKNDGKSIVLGLGSHLDVEVAVSRALAEMNQMLVLEEQKLVLDDDRKVSLDDAVLADWTKNKSLASETYCAPSGNVSLSAYARPHLTDLKDAVEHCVRVVSDKGHDMIVLDHSRPGVDFSTARVVVPGMRHFWARFREGRLTKAPVEMGWRDTPLAEADLNPIPFFL